MKSLELTTAITVLANGLACGLTVDEIALLAGVFVQLGDTLATIAAERSLMEERSKKTDSENNSPQITE